MTEVLLKTEQTAVLKSSFLVQILCTSRKSKTLKKKKKLEYHPPQLYVAWPTPSQSGGDTKSTSHVRKTLRRVNHPDANVRVASSQLLKLQSRRYCSVTVAHAEQLLLDESSHNSLKLLSIKWARDWVRIQTQTSLLLLSKLQIIRKQYLKVFH